MNPARRELLLRWLLALGVFALLLFFFSPAWAAFRLWARVPEMGGMIEVRRGVSVLQQIAHPGAVIEDPLHRAIQWRLLFPGLAHVLSLPSWLVFALAPLGCAAVLGYVVTLLRRASASWTQTAISSVVIGAASWFFTSTEWLGYYDSWLALGLLILAFGRSAPAVWAACLWAPWVDERIVLAAPLALFCRWLSQAELGRGATPSRPAEAAKESSQTVGWASRPYHYNLSRDVLIPTALLGAFVLVRLVVLSRYSDATATVSGYLGARSYLEAPLSQILFGVGEGLRAGWLFVIVAVLGLARRPTIAASVGVAVILTLVAGLATAQDYSRSMTMLLPIAVLGAVYAVTRATGTWLARAIPICAGATLMLPAHHVMSDRVNPIYYLYHELAALDSPPAAAMPELYELRAIHAMERGDFSAAERDLTLAIKLATNPASPARQRGVLYASQNRWADARHDFVLATEHDAENPDAWLLQAQASLATGDASTAQAEFERARSLAPAEWMSRPDVARFATRFGQMKR
jgi:hypothetical protein